MGIQFNQIDNLQSTFTSLSGDLQGQITEISGTTTGMASGDFIYAGNKFFTGNVDFSGAQGILVDPNNIYTPNDVFAGKIKVGGSLATPRNSTAGPEGILQVTGGESYFDGQLNMRNDAGISATSITGGTGEFYQGSGSFIQYATGTFGKIEGEELQLSGSVSGIVRLLELPDYTATGTIPDPASGALFRSGNYLMIV